MPKTDDGEPCTFEVLVPFIGRIVQHPLSSPFAATLVVAQPQTTSTENLLYRAAFLNEVLHDLLLAADNPTCDGY